jgi:SNF2-related domain
MPIAIKVQAGGYWRSLTLTPIDNDLIKVNFGYNYDLVQEVKGLEGARWHPEEKYWTIKRSQRNIFVLEYLQGQNPYAPYEGELINHESKRPLFEHQLYDVRCGLTRKHMLFAVDMGAGKSLIAIEIMENSGFKSEESIWVGPKNALRSVEMELLKWESKIWPQFWTYDSLAKLIQNWPKGKPAPRILILDEIHKIKNPTAKRSQAAKYLADNMRKEWDRDCYILGLSGTPSPKSPADWYNLCEVICPGFIKESNIFKFKNRLGLIIQKESTAGGVYPELISWWDDEKKCKICGKYEEDLNHSILYMTEPSYHQFTPSINEVYKLYERMKGLVVVQFKKDVLKELPEKIYRIIRCTPIPETLRAAKLIVAKSPRAITAAILLRELSDGFQYVEQEVGERICSQCFGQKLIKFDVFIKYDCEQCGHTSEIQDDNCENCKKELYSKEITYKEEDVTCHTCSGSGVNLIYQREAIQVSCPKEEIVIDTLEEHDEGGRIVIFAGFTGSVDRVVSIALKEKWNVIRVDSRNWHYFESGKIDKTHMSATNMLRMFQDKKRDVEKIAFIGQADSAGIGLTLTESPTAFYYSNSFISDSRSQSENRIHRPGMDLNKGATIVDCFHLPSDELVYNNLMKKLDLQALSMGELKQVMG